MFWFTLQLREDLFKDLGFKTNWGESKVLPYLPREILQNVKGLTFKLIQMDVFFFPGNKIQKYLSIKNVVASPRSLRCDVWCWVYFTTPQNATLVLHTPLYKNVVYICTYNLCAEPSKQLTCTNLKTNVSYIGELLITMRLVLYIPTIQNIHSDITLQNWWFSWVTSSTSMWNEWTTVRQYTCPGGRLPTI